MEKNSSGYTIAEVSRIIRRALEKKQEETISHEELVEVAKELQIDEEEIEAAVKDDKQQQKLEQKIDRSKAGLKYHFYCYLGVNSLLLVIDIMTPGPWWFQWPLLGWGIGIFGHYKGIQIAERKMRARG